MYKSSKAHLSLLLILKLDFDKFIFIDLIILQC